MVELWRLLERMKEYKTEPDEANARMKKRKTAISSP